METERKKTVYWRVAIPAFALIVIAFLLFMFYSGGGFSGACVGDPRGLHFGGCGQHSDSCTMPAGITCSGVFLASDGGILQLTLFNEFQKPIVVTSVTCTKKPDQFIRLLNTTMENAQAYTFLLNCNGESGELLDEFAPGETFSGKINVEYYFEDEGPDNLRKLSGDVYLNVK